MNQQPIKFEVAVYNKDVRDAMKEGERHPFLDDAWADIHWIEVRAYTADAARQKIQRKYPPHRGYVITEVQEALSV